jgi:hypothetical protein
MIRCAWTLCVLISLALAGAAQAHDSGPAIARATEALRQGPISFDSAAQVSEQQADAVNQRLTRSTGIAVAILPADFQFSAVGAAKELALHLNRQGTIITLLGGDVGATSTDVEGPVLGALVRQSQQVYNREGTVPALTGLIDGIEAARDAPADDGGGGQMAVVLVTVGALVGGSVLALLGLRRARRA